MDSDEDIYSDLPLGNFDEGIEKLQESNQNLIKEINYLQEELTRITQERDDLQTKCRTLSINISSLLKTARAEIQRKDRKIDELRKQVAENTARESINRKRRYFDDEVIPAKRNNSSTKGDSFTKEAPVSITDSVGNRVQNGTSTSETSKASRNVDSNSTFVKNKACIPNVNCKTLYSQRMFNKIHGLPNAPSSQQTGSIESNVKEPLENLIVDQNGFHNSKAKQELTINVDENMVNIIKNPAVTAPSETNTEVAVEKSKVSTDPPSQPKNATHLKDKGEIKNTENVTSTDNDSSKFLRPTSLTVVKKCKKTVISPVLSDWSGLVKTVDINLRKNEKPREVSENSDVNAKSDDNVYEHSSQDKNDSVNNTEENELMNQLFGSPLKWTENSNGSAPNMDLSSPTVYEDSCGAHIENVKFNTNSAKQSSEMPSNKSTKDNNRVVNKVQQLNMAVTNKEALTKESKSVRAFGGFCSKNGENTKSLFTNLKSDSCKFSAIGSTKTQGYVPTLPFESKYEDSVLGQFDDTTQFVSALKKIESRISPLNTPVKSVSQSNTLPTDCPVMDPNQLVPKIFPQSMNSSDLNGIISRPTSEKPINILVPRKTPRKITYSKPNVENSNSKPAVPMQDTPTKCNRFAINDAFICQQEEKVLKNKLNNVRDPIAITICAKSKKGKESILSHSPKGKQSNLNLSSPKKRSTNLNLSPRGKQANLVNNPKGKSKNPSSEENRINPAESFHENLKLLNMKKPNEENKTQNKIESLSPSFQSNKTNLNENLHDTKALSPKELASSLAKKFIKIPNSSEKRVQNFKCSSQLKKPCKQYLTLQHESIKERGVPLKKVDELNRNSNQTSKINQVLSNNEQNPRTVSPRKLETPQNKTEKPINKKYSDSIQNKKNEKLPIIVRSSKKPQFRSTTVSDDDYTCSISEPRNSSEQMNTPNSKCIELREWILTPITFDFDKKPHKSSIHRHINKEVTNNPREDGPKVKTPSENNQMKSTTSHAAQIVIKESKTFPNATIIRGRRPMNFGVSVSLN